MKKLFIPLALFPAFFAFAGSLSDAVTEPEREIQRLGRLLQLKVTPYGKNPLLIIESETPGSDAKFRALGPRLASALQEQTGIGFMVGGQSLVARAIPRQFLGASAKEVYLQEMAMMAPDGVKTNHILVTNNVFHPVGPIVTTPTHSIVLELVHETQVPTRTKSRSLWLTLVAGPASSLFGLDASARNSIQEGELALNCSIADHPSQVATPHAFSKMTCAIRRIEKSGQLGLRYSGSSAASGGLGADFSDVIADSSDLLLTAAGAKATLLACCRLTGVLPSTVSATGDNDPISRAAAEAVWRNASIEDRRSSLMVVKRIYLGHGLTPTVLPNPESTHDASHWRTLVEQMPFLVFDPAPTVKVPRKQIRIVFEFWNPQAFASLRPRLEGILENTPGVTFVSPDPTTHIGYLVGLPQKRLSELRDHLLWKMRELTGADVDFQVPVGEGRTLYVQRRSLF